MIIELARNITLSAAIATAPMSFENQESTAPDTGKETAKTAFVNTPDLNVSLEQEEFKELRQSIDNFAWEDFDDDEKLSQFLQQLAGGYIDSTIDSYHTRIELENNTEFFRSYFDLSKKAIELSPGIPTLIDFIELAYESNDDGFYNTNYLVNIEAIDDYLDRSEENPGYFLADRLFRAWMIEDASFNDEIGDLIGNSDFKIDELNNKEVIGYFGGSILAEDENSTLSLFHEHLAHAVSARILVEKVGLDHLDLEKYGRTIINHIPQEANVLAAISIDQEIDIDDFYFQYSISNAEWIYKMIGRNIMHLDVENDDLDRGKFDQDLYNGFRFAQSIDRGLDHPDQEIEFYEDPFIVDV